MMLLISHRPLDAPPDRWVMPVGTGGLQPAGGISDRATGLHLLNDRLSEWTGILSAASLMRSGMLATESGWIGACHYRRLMWLTADPHRSTRAKFYRKSDAPLAACRALMDPAFVSEALEVFDCIAPRSIFYDRPLSAQYRDSHRAADWEVFIDVLRQVFGTDAGRFFDRTHTFTPYSMFLVPTERFLALCEEAYAVIEQLLTRLEPMADKYQNRAIGFLMERFVTFALQHRRLRVLETPVVLTDPDAK